MSKIFIGTSGWNYYHWKEIFYPNELTQRNWLDYYAAHFNCVEVNVTFYRLMRKKTFEGWREKTPKNFSFVVKGSRLITHLKRLNAVGEPLELFMENVQGLDKKLAAVFWQFPPSFKKNTNKLKTFLKMIKQSGSRHIFEFRNISWFDDEIYSLMKECNACLCIAHSGKHYPCLKEITADFIYLRFHGAGSLYASNYPEEELEDWAQFVRPHTGGSHAKDIFAFFNNDAYGYAVNNALTFRKLLAGS